MLGERRRAVNRARHRHPNPAGGFERLTGPTTRYCQRRNVVSSADNSLWCPLTAASLIRIDGSCVSIAVYRKLKAIFRRVQIIFFFICNDFLCSCNDPPFLC